ERKADARVPRRPLDDRPAGPQASVRFGVAHDIKGSAILYRSARIRIFALAPDFASGRFARSLEEHQRRVTDQVQAVFRYDHVPDLSPHPSHRKTASLAPAETGLCRRAPRQQRRTPDQMQTKGLRL